MKVVQKLIFMFVLVGGLAVAASAQKDDKKPLPPKPPPPVINPGEGKKPPKGEDKPKKPTYALVFSKASADGESA